MKKVLRIIRDVPQHWVGDGFPVRSLFWYGSGTDFDPFLLLDYAGPYDFPPAAGKRGVDVHPHKGIENVTILYQGELAHQDSSGGSGRLGFGDVQWMTMKAVELALSERPGHSIQIQTETDARVLILTGEPVFGQGPCVMDTREEIHKAILDNQSGKMGQLDKNLPEGSLK
jgi:redox-sensitive bicupin YhaK (pirin superfamily)